MRPRAFRAIRAALLGALLLGAPQGCRSLGPGDPSEGTAAADTATLRVQNDNFSDVDVYLVRSGLAQRIGRVGAGRTERFPLRPALLGPGDVSFIVSTVDGRGSVSSGSLLVSGGQTVEFRISAVISQSMATVR